MNPFPEREFVEQLLVTPSPTGFEQAGQEVWVNYVDEFADDLQTDAYGSAAAKLNTDAEAVTVMLEAHADEIGMIVKHITEEGFIHVGKLGGSDPTIARAKHVSIHNKRGVVEGVVGNTAIHLQDKKNGKGKQPKWQELFIDIGVASREEALKLVQIGDPITFTDDFEYLNDDTISGRALDNRIGGFMIAQVLKNLSENRPDLNVNVVVLNSVQEEIGGYGARMMSYRLDPDMAYVTDVTHATDTPGIDHAQHGLIKLREGPVVQHGGANHPNIVDFVEETADDIDLNIQHDSVSVRTGTDTDSIFYQKTGIPSALMSLPLRYMHSPVETASVQDVNSLIKLMTKSVLALEPNQTFETF